MSDNKSKKSKKKTKKKSTKKVIRKKAAKKSTKKKTSKKKEEISSSTSAVEQSADAPKVEVKSVPSQKTEYTAVDSETLERLNAKFINLTGYPIRVMCDQKWAQIPPDQNNSARVLYSVALSNKIEDVEVYSHGVNAITGLPTPQEGKFYIVLPEVRFLLPERSDLLTHGELIYDGETNKPLGFKNFFCSATNAKNLVPEELVNASPVK
jgi:hypothetical protein|tara:strand:- start:579 stop:1205 length:627 start_codon:yes stop_codon:yes gene_type:complete